MGERDGSEGINEYNILSSELFCRICVIFEIKRKKGELPVD